MSDSENLFLGLIKALDKYTHEKEHEHPEHYDHHHHDEEMCHCHGECDENCQCGCKDKEKKEDVETQPDMFNPELNSFYLDGHEIKVTEDQKYGGKKYTFDSYFGDKLESVMRDPTDTATVCDIIAQGYAEDDDLAEILDSMNRADSLTFETTNNGPITVSASDVFDHLTKYKRDLRFANENEDEDEENSDWMEKWHNSKVANEAVGDLANMSRQQNESLSSYISNVRKVFNEKFSK